MPIRSCGAWRYIPLTRSSCSGPSDRADSSAKILTAGLLGEQYVGIEAGADMENLKAGSRIARTQSAVVLETLISQFLYSSAEKGGK